MCLQTRKTKRTLKVISRPAPGELGVEIHDYDGRSTYLIYPTVPFSGCGRAWMWQGLLGKRHNAPYEVNVGDGSGDGQKPTCDCPAGRRGKPCRHVAGTLKLIECGKIEL